MRKIVIVGAGASGMMCAIEAAKNSKNTHIVILEHNTSAGRKILATGNGRCNLTNMTMNIDCYRSHDMDRLSELTGHISPEDVIGRFKEMGMLSTSKNGYVYPYSGQAATVNDTLVCQCLKLGVEFVYDAHVMDIDRTDDASGGFEVKVSRGIVDDSGNRQKVRESYQADAVVLACGSKAYPKLGSDGSGYSILHKRNVKLIDVVPALTGLKCKEKIYHIGAGVRTGAIVKLYVDHELKACEQGELQLTDYGISGIPVFQVSRYASYGIADGCKVHADIDFMPEYDMDTIGALIDDGLGKDKTIIDVLSGMLNSKLAGMLLAYCRIDETAKKSALTHNNMSELVEAIKEFYTVIVGTNDYDQSQVCAGGVKLSEIDNTYQLNSIPGMYVIGELLDVDGICGGYNLHFAWESAIIAGRNLTNTEV